MFFIGTAIKNAPICTRTRRCIFPDYIDENAIQINFQRVPPFLDGSVCKFPAIAVEMEPSSLTAPFMYARPLNTRIQRPRNHIFINRAAKMAQSLYEKLVRRGLYVRVCTHESVRTGLSTRICTYGSVRTKLLYVRAQAFTRARSNGWASRNT